MAAPSINEKTASLGGGAVAICVWDEGQDKFVPVETTSFASQASIDALSALIGTAEDTSASVTVIGLLTRIAEGVEALAV